MGLVLLLRPAAAFADTTVIEFGTSTTAVSASWPTTSTDTLSLRQIVEETIAHNLKIKIDEARVLEARALYSKATAAAYPVSRFQAVVGGPVPEAKTTRINDPSSVTRASVSGDFNFGELGVTFRTAGEAIQPLYTFGKIDAAKKAARHLISAAKSRTRITRADVVFDVYRAYWAYQLTHSFSQSLRDGAQILEKVLVTVEDLLENDSPQVTENDRLRLIHALATVRVRLNETDNGTLLAHRALALLMGREQSNLPRVSVRHIDEIGERPPRVETFLQAALEYRPELEALRELVAAQRSWANFRRAQLWPDLFLGAFIQSALTTNATNQTNPFINDNFNFFDFGLGIGIRFELDVWNKLAEIERAEAELKTRLAQSAAAGQAIKVEIRSLHDRQISRYERVALLRRAHRAARGWLNASILSYDIGTGDAGELIDAFLARATAEGELTKTYFDIHVAHAGLSRASGELVSVSTSQ